MVKVIVSIFILTLLIAIIVVLTSSGFEFGREGEGSLNKNDTEPFFDTDGKSLEQNEKSFLGWDFSSKESNPKRWIVKEKTTLRCGQPINTYDSRIVGGKEASIAEFP